MDQTRVTRIGKMKARPGQVDALRAFLESKVVPALEAATGCQSVQLLQSRIEPERFVIIEVWDTIEAHQASVKDISSRDIDAVMQLLVEAPRGEYYFG
jgi:quinol monooxygenase YgiN